MSEKVLSVLKIRSSRKKFIIFVFVLIVGVALLSRKTLRESKVVDNEDEVVIWNMDEWFQIKNEYTSMLSSLRDFDSDQLDTHNRTELCQNVPDGLKKRIKIFKYPLNFNATTTDVYNYVKDNYLQTRSGKTIF